MFVSSVGDLVAQPEYPCCGGRARQGPASFLVKAVNLGEARGGVLLQCRRLAESAALSSSPSVSSSSSGSTRRRAPGSAIFAVRVDQAVDHRRMRISSRATLLQDRDFGDSRRQAEIA